MSSIHITKDGKCVYCGAKQKICTVCKKPFPNGREDKESCGGTCNTRKSRKKKKAKIELEE
jgi:hypothetical protein